MLSSGSSFLVLTVLLNTLTASAQWTLGQNDVCFALQTFSPRTTIAQGVLSLMGGEWSIQHEEIYQTQDRIFAIPLNATFDARSLLAANAYSYIDVQGLQEIWQGAFWKDSTGEILYNFAAYNGTDQEPTSQLTTFNVTSSTFGTVNVDGGDFNYGQRDGALWTSSEGTGLNFFIGGINPVPPGMITFDSNTLSWTNTTTDASLTESESGQMVFTRFGANGTLVVIGGYDKTQNNSAGHYTTRNMSNIGIYDINSSTWYNMTATGDVPVGRANLCAAVSAAPDYSSANIMIYGGYNPNLNRGWEQTYILSLPSFTWINVTDTSSANIDLSLHETAPVGRRGHQCQMYNNRQLISIGGDITFGWEPVNSLVCNASYPSVRVFDASALTWQDQFEPDLGDYYVPDKVISVIGGDGNGTATLRQPSGGWPASATALMDVFSTTVAATSQQSTALSSSSSSPSSSSNHTGAIAGGVVGGVVGLAAILGAIFFLLRHRRRRTRKAQQNGNLHDTKYAVGHELDGTGRAEKDDQLSTKPQELETERNYHEMNGTRDEERHQPAVTAPAELPG